jgi:hypothetical protein
MCIFTCCFKPKVKQQPKYIPADKIDKYIDLCEDIQPENIKSERIEKSNFEFDNKNIRTSMPNLVL